MRHSEFWQRMNAALGEPYATVWAREYAITSLGSQTAIEALAAGVQPQQVWRAVHEVLELPARDR